MMQDVGRRMQKIYKSVTLNERGGGSDGYNQSI